MVLFAINTYGYVIAAQDHNWFGFNRTVATLLPICPMSSFTPIANELPSNLSPQYQRRRQAGGGYPSSIDSDAYSHPRPPDG